MNTLKEAKIQIALTYHNPYSGGDGLEIPRLLWFLITTSMGWIVVGIGLLAGGMICWLTTPTTLQVASLLMLVGAGASASAILLRVLHRRRKHQAAEAALARLCPRLLRVPWLRLPRLSTTRDWSTKGRCRRFW